MSRVLKGLGHKIEIILQPLHLILGSLCPVLWNRNCFYGSGSGSYFLKVTVPVPVPALYLDHTKQFNKKAVEFFFAFLHIKLFYKGKVYKFNKFIVKWE
jgi:hypothetical protein